MYIYRRAFFVLVFDCCNCITCLPFFIRFKLFLSELTDSWFSWTPPSGPCRSCRQTSNWHEANWCRTVPWWRKFGHGWVLVDCEKKGTSFADCNPNIFLFFCCFCLLDLVNFSSQHDCNSNLQELILRWCPSILWVSGLDGSSWLLPNVESEGAKKKNVYHTENFCVLVHVDGSSANTHRLSRCVFHFKESYFQTIWKVNTKWLLQLVKTTLNAVETQSNTSFLYFGTGIYISLMTGLLTKHISPNFSFL